MPVPQVHKINTGHYLLILLSVHFRNEYISDYLEKQKRLETTEYKSVFRELAGVQGSIQGRK